DPIQFVSALPTHELSSWALYQAEGSGAGVKFVQERGLFSFGEKRMLEARLRQPDKVNGVEAHAMRVKILVADGSFKHGGIVARKRDRQAAAKERCQWVLVVTRCFPSQLARECSGPEIARGANLQGNAPRSEKIHGALVAHHSDSVADAFSSQDFD